MNSIPTTFNEIEISTTITGGSFSQEPDSLNISVILINSGSTHLRQQLFENLLACKFASIISIEKNPKNFAIEDLSKKYPEIKFILPHEEASDGVLINIAAGEVTSDYFLVLRDNLYIPSGVILSHMAERLTKDQIYCVVPRLVDNNKTPIPGSYTPTAKKSKFEIYTSKTVTDGIPTLYPFDYIALYNREKFIQLGGFDSSIKSAYWQNLDLALRAWLWGEQIKITTLIQFTYIEEPTIEDKTLNLDYLRFYLKNQLPKFKPDLEIGVLKLSSFFVFMFNSSCGFFEAKRQFKAARKWVSINKYRFKTDLQNLITSWRS